MPMVKMKLSNPVLRMSFGGLPKNQLMLPHFKLLNSLMDQVPLRGEELLN